MIKDEPYDAVRMRRGMRECFTKKSQRYIFGFRCAWCETGLVMHHWHPHHALIKSSTARHWAVDNAVENRVPLCWKCHDAHGQSAEMTVKALDYLIDRLGAERIARWYISLWRVHGLSVAQGTLPRNVAEQDWRDYLELVILPL